MYGIWIDSVNIWVIPTRSNVRFCDTRLKSELVTLDSFSNNANKIWINVRGSPKRPKRKIFIQGIWESELGPHQNNDLAKNHKGVSSFVIKW